MRVVRWRLRVYKVGMVVEDAEYRERRAETVAFKQAYRDALTARARHSLCTKRAMISVESSSCGRGGS